MNLLDSIIVRLDRGRPKPVRLEDRLEPVADVVRQRLPHRPETSSPAANVFGSIWHDLAVRSFKEKGSQFTLSDQCTGCGQCTRLCPRSNIVLQDGRPQFGHDCECCHACIQWCPRFAIRHPDFDDEPIQRHHPGVRADELFRRS